MGIYDRDYYRRDMPAPVEGVPGPKPGLSITAWLIIINVGVFVLSFFMVESPLAEWWGRNLELWPNFGQPLVHPSGYVFWTFRPWQLVTAMFLHGDFWHILFNMWFLWLFGKGIEQLYGRWNFLGFYMTAGIAASILFVVTSLLRADPRAAIGASGAVMGVVVLYAFHFPRQRVYVWGIVPILIWQLAIFFVAIDLLFFLGGSSGNIANAAHLGGAAFAAIYRFVDLRFDTLFKIFKRRAPPPPSFPPKDRGFPTVDPNVRARVDSLLDKISKQGLTSLTDEERDFLRDASNQYRDR